MWSTTSPVPVRRAATRRRPTLGVSPGEPIHSSTRSAFFNLPPTHHPTSMATRAAVTRRRTVTWGPSSGMESSTASSPSSGVATRNAIAAAGGAPRWIRLRYSGTTPQEQIGKGRPIAIPRTDWEIPPPFSIHRTDRCGRNALSNPAKR